MAKLEFKVAADYKEVDKLTDSVNRLENQVKGLKSSDLGLDSWITQFDKFQRELKAKASEIEVLKARILSFDNMQDKKELDNLGRQLETAKNQYYQLAQEAANGANRFQASYNKVSSALLASQKNVDSVTWKLIEQKEVVANLQSEVRRLNEAYRAAGKDEKGAISAQLTSKKKQLEDERFSLNSLRAEQERAKLAVKSLKDEVASYEKTTRSVTGVQNENELSLKKMLAAFGGAAAIKSFVSDMVRVRGEFQKTQMAFETMLGSKEKADMLMSQMVQTAAKTPFDLRGVADGAKQLLAYGTQAKDVNDTLIRLGNIASGLNIPLGEMVYLYGTTQTQGRLFTQDVRQFMGRGIPLVKEMASLLGKTEEEINKMVTAGQIGFSQVQQVIEKMTNEGGKFYNLMEKQSQTLSGQISNLGDAWDQMLNSIGEETQGVTSATISMATDVVENYEEVGKVLVALIGTYGSYKAAVIVTNMVLREQAAANAMVAASNGVFSKGLAYQWVWTERLQKAQSLLNKTMLNNPYVLLATVVAGLAVTLWALHDGTTAAEKAQKQLNKEHEEAVQRKEELTSKTEGLISKINSETESAYAQIKAYKELIKLFPELGNRSFEEFKNLPQDQQKKILSRINEDREITDTVKAYEDDLKRIEYLKKVINATATLPNSGYALNKLNEELDKANHLANLHKKEIEEIKQNQWEANTPIEEKIKHYQDIQARLEKERDELNSQLNPSKVLKSYTGEMADSWLNAKNTIENIRLDALNQQIEETGRKIDSLTGKDASVVKNKSYWEKQKKEAETALEAIDSKQKKLMDAGNFKGIDSKIVKKYKEQSKLFKEAEKELKVYSSSSKQESEANKRLKAQQELSRSILDSELKLQAERIAIMKDGKDKRVLLADQEYKETLSAIEKARAEYQKKVKEAGQTEDPAVMATFDSRESAAKSKRDTDVAGINKEYFDDYAKRTKALTDVFLSEEQKRLSAVKERYDEERKWAQEQLKTGGMSDEQYQSYVINIDKAEAEESLRALLDKYKDYARQKEELERQYTDEIATLTQRRTDANKAEVDAAISEARKRHKEEAAGLDFEAFKKSIDFSEVFGNLNRLSDQALTELIQKMKEFRSEAATNLKTDELKEYMDALEKLRDESFDRKNGWAEAFGLIPDVIKERTKLEEEYAAAEELALKAAEKKKAAEEELQDSTSAFNSLIKKLTGAQGDLTDANEEYVVSLIKRKGLEQGLSEEQIEANIQTYKESAASVQQLAQGVADAGEESNKASSLFAKAGEALQSFKNNAGNTLAIVDAIIKGVHQGIQAMSQISDSFLGMYEALGKDTSIDTTIGKFGEFMNLLSEFDNYAYSAWENLKSGNIAGAVADTVSSITSVIKNIAAWGDKKKERKIELLQEQVEELDKSYEKLNDSIEKAYSVDASALIDQQNEMLEKQKLLIQQQIAEEESKKHSDNDRIKEWKNQLEDIDKTLADNKEKAKDAIFGEDLKSAIDNFANAYAEAWAGGEDRAKSMKDVARNMIKQTVIELIKSSAGLGETVKKIREMILGFLSDGVVDEWEQRELDSYIESETARLDAKYGWADKYMKEDKGIDLGISGDSLADTIVEGLRAGKAGIKDFSGSFEEMMKTAVLNSLKTKYLEGPLKEFQKKFAALSESGGQLTEAEIEELRAMYAEIIDGAKVQFDSLKEISGLDFLDDSDNTLKGAFAKASQESIDLLAGQAGAQRAAIEAIREMFRFIYELQKQGWQDVRIIRDLTTKVDKNTELVAENTREIRAIAQNISEHTKRTVETLEGTIDVKVKM